MKHGTGNAYNHGCKCRVCADYHQRRCAEARDARLAERKWVNGRLVATRPGLVHGTGNGYTNYGCRCDPCSAFNAERCAEWKAKRRLAS